jgi:hypothetical protein
MAVSPIKMAGPAFGPASLSPLKSQTTSGNLVMFPVMMVMGPGVMLAGGVIFGQMLARPGVRRHDHRTKDHGRDSMNECHLSHDVKPGRVTAFTDRLAHAGVTNWFPPTENYFSASNSFSFGSMAAAQIL